MAETFQIGWSFPNGWNFPMDETINPQIKIIQWAPNTRNRTGPNYIRNKLLRILKAAREKERRVTFGETQIQMVAGFSVDRIQVRK